MPILRPDAARFHERRISSVTFTSAHLYGNVYMRVDVAHALANSSDFGLMGSKFHKMGDSLPWMPLNHREKFDATSFNVGREISNHTNTQKINTLITVTNISTPCLGMCG